ncbi:MAG TPA: NAD(+)/NADH kinase [Acidimicrobiales bacterium]|nr:NAD(+)/NADH kinase [Acidimicrobiales bacterium]
MAVVALVPHQLRPEAADLARQAIEWLGEWGHDVRVPDDDAAASGLEDWAVPAASVGEGTDLAVALGGDGTMLRTVDLVCAADVPVLGVNVGQLGYLTAVEPAGLYEALKRFFAGDYTVEPRMTLEVEVGGVARMALNEAVLEKTLSGHTVRLAMSINDGPFLTTAADGLIVSTPTGSTAYNFSARGPIVSPRLRGLVVTPVSPHTLFDRSLVLDDSEEVRLEVLEGRPAALVVDGRPFGELAPGDTMVCRAGRHDARFVTLDGRDFHQILKAKFSLADR